MAKAAKSYELNELEAKSQPIECDFQVQEEFSQNVPEKILF